MSEQQLGVDEIFDADYWRELDEAGVDASVRDARAHAAARRMGAQPTNGAFHMTPSDLARTAQVDASGLMLRPETPFISPEPVRDDRPLPVAEIIAVMPLAAALQTPPDQRG